MTVTWTVDPAAPTTVISNAPATPTRTRNTTLLVSGTGVTDYRWKPDNSFYRAETPIANPIIITNFDPGAHVVSVIGKVGGIFQGTNNPTTVRWTYDPLYGYTLAQLTKVQSLQYSNVGTNSISFAWDGRSSNGVLQPPGFYTVRLTLADALGRTNFTTRVVRIDDLSGASSPLADVIRGPKNPYARRNVAVWQDQSDGTFQTYAQYVHTNGAPILKHTTGVLAQDIAAPA